MRKTKDDIVLPPAVRKLWKAREELRKHFRYKFDFTLDGKLVGDIGEAVAFKAFKLKSPQKRTRGVDAVTPAGRTVQIKATGKETCGPAFSPGEHRAEQLLFLHIDFEVGVARIVYNGPERPIRSHVRNIERGTKSVPLSKVLAEKKALCGKGGLRRHK